MKTFATAAFGLSLMAGCAPDATLQAQADDAAIAQASAYAAAPTCGPASITDLRQILPDTKIIGALELDVQHLRRGKLFPEVETALKTEAPEVLDAMKECGVPLSKVNGLIVGFGDGDDVVVGARAHGLGSAKTLDCLAKKIEKASGDKPWTRNTKGCITTLDIPTGDGQGYVVGRDMVVFTNKALQAAVEDRIAGKGKSALEGRLGWIKSEVDTSGTAWMGVNLPPSAAAGLGPELAGLSHAGMGMDTTKGLGLSASMSFSSPAQAKSARTKIDEQVTMAKAMLPMLGLSSTVGDSISVSSKGSRVELGMFLSPSDLETMRSALGGAMGSGPGPGPGVP